MGAVAALLATMSVFAAAPAAMAADGGPCVGGHLVVDVNTVHLNEVGVSGIAQGVTLQGGVPYYTGQASIKLYCSNDPSQTPITSTNASQIKMCALPNAGLPGISVTTPFTLQVSDDGGATWQDTGCLMNPTGTQVFGDNVQGNCLTSAFFGSIVCPADPNNGTLPGARNDQNALVLNVDVTSNTISATNPSGAAVIDIPNTGSMNLLYRASNFIDAAYAAAHPDIDVFQFGVQQAIISNLFGSSLACKPGTSTVGPPSVSCPVNATNPIPNLSGTDASGRGDFNGGPVDSAGWEYFLTNATFIQGGLFETTVTPELDSLLLFGAGMAGMAGYARTKSRARRTG